MQRRVFGFLIFSVLAAACAHDPPKKPGLPPKCEKPEPVTVYLSGGRWLNPGEDGQSLPTIVRVYLLKETTQMEAASPSDLQRGDRDFLSSDLVDVRELTLRPNSQEKVILERPPTANYLAIIGLFRVPEGGAWRIIKRLPLDDPYFCRRKVPTNRLRVGVLLDANRVDFRQP